MRRDRLPQTEEVADKLLQLLHHHPNPQRPDGIYKQLAQMMKLTPTQLQLLRATTSEPLWNNRVQTAREHLARAGFIDRSQRGLWGLTFAGRKEADRRDSRPSGAPPNSVAQDHQQGRSGASKPDNDPGSAEAEYREGERRLVELQVIRRSKTLSTQARAFHGLNCSACTFNFEAFYGDIGRSFIEVHHLVDLPP